MFRVVTVAREYGSGGGAIAQCVAQRLGWKLLDRNLIEAVARSAQVDPETARRCDEHVDSWWHRINRGGLWSAAIVAGARGSDAQFFDAETMAALSREVIAGAAAEGRCVIVGRGGQCVLKGCPDALHVFIYAPLGERLARVQRRLGINEEKDAWELVRSTDHTRAVYLHRYFGLDWRDPNLYQIMVSSHLGDESVTRLIIDACESSGVPTLSRACGV